MRASNCDSKDYSSTSISSLVSAVLIVVIIFAGIVVYANLVLKNTSTSLASSSVKSSVTISSETTQNRISSGSTSSGTYSSFTTTSGSYTSLQSPIFLLKPNETYPNTNLTAFGAGFPPSSTGWIFSPQFGGEVCCFATTPYGTFVITYYIPSFLHGGIYTIRAVV